MRRKRPLQLGEVLLVDLPQHLPPGHEQEGYRPAVVVGLPERLGTPRYPMLTVVPLTTQGGAWADPSPDLYPRLAAGTAGLPVDSVILLDNTRCVDRRRVRGALGTLTEEEYAPLQEGLRRMLDLPEEAESAEGTEGEPEEATEGTEGEALKAT